MTRELVFVLYIFILLTLINISAFTLESNVK